MIKKIALGIVLAFGVTATPTLAQAPAAAQSAALTADSPLGALLGNAAAKSVLERHLGAEFVNNPQLSAAASMPLSGLAQYMPGQLTPEKIAQINTDLAALPR